MSPSFNLHYKCSTLHKITSVPRKHESVKQLELYRFVIIRYIYKYNYTYTMAYIQVKMIKRCIHIQKLILHNKANIFPIKCL